MKKCVLVLLSWAIPLFSFAQFVEVAYGPGYGDQAYYRFSDDAVASVANTAWDLAFTTMGLQDAGIHINEAAAFMGTELELHLAPTENFEDVIDPMGLEQRLLNDEQSWNYGALNSPRNPDDPFDYGWGAYNPFTHTIEGNKVFVLKLRDGNYRKLQVISLEGAVYSFRLADLDGSNEASFSIDKNDFPDTGLAYFSLASGTTTGGVLNTGEWDLLFTRYSTPLDDGAGNTLDYSVTGTLSGLGVEVARANGVDPLDVSFEAYQDSLETALDVIGYDWKEFDLSSFQWYLPPDRAYFVKTVEGRVWKLVFIDFEGSSTGNAVFEKTDMGLVSSADAKNAAFADFTVFPNPMVNEATVALTARKAGKARLELRSLAGREIWHGQAELSAGFNVQTLPVWNIPAGTYFLTIRLEGEQLTRKLIKTQ